MSSFSCIFLYILTIAHAAKHNTSISGAMNWCHDISSHSSTTKHSMVKSLLEATGSSTCDNVPIKFCWNFSLQWVVKSGSGDFQFMCHYMRIFIDKVINYIYSEGNWVFIEKWWCYCSCKQQCQGEIVQRHGGPKSKGWLCIKKHSRNWFSFTEFCIGPFSMFQARRTDTCNRCVVVLCLLN